jgi:hypothetical protein
MHEDPSVRWLLLTTSLSGRAASTARVRLWRALKDLGVGSLRDGVSLLPATAETRAAFTALAREVEADGGTAWLLELPAQVPPLDDALIRLFDRSADCAELLQTLTRLGAELPGWDEAAARRELRKVEKALAGIQRVDFFPGAATEQARAAVGALATEINCRFSPQEPSPGIGEVRRLDAAAFQGRVWATRRHLWVDRVASAWLIRRFIDPDSRFVWLDRPADCPADTLGFDFDGAAFSHVGERVTFEVLMVSFGLDADPGLVRLGQLVHYLDASGLPVAEAPGFEAVLAGLRDVAPDDDALLTAATPLLDALYRSYSGACA